MTKAVRVENADTSNHKLVVEVWNKAGKEGDSDVLERTVPLSHPTALTTEYVHDRRYLVVKEVSEQAAQAASNS